LKLNLIIAESALELIPEEVRNHRAVLADAKRRGVDPSRILLDRSIHHAAMLRLPDEFRRGRPDLIHITLLSVTSTPLYQDGLVKVFIHSNNDIVLELEEKTRPPKSYPRFRNLIEDALSERPRIGLIRAYDSSLGDLVKTLRPDHAIGLSIIGKSQGLADVASQVAANKAPVVLIGGFPRGHFSPTTLKAVDLLVRMDERPLDAHVVASRLTYEVEQARKNK
jgi:rRNA small subunit pseudouridine methyltransferase Nep1